MHTNNLSSSLNSTEEEDLSTKKDFWINNGFRTFPNVNTLITFIFKIRYIIFLENNINTIFLMFTSNIFYNILIFILIYLIGLFTNIRKRPWSMLPCHREAHLQQGKILEYRQHNTRCCRIRVHPRSTKCLSLCTP